jgi:hypothetical protein
VSKSDYRITAPLLGFVFLAVLSIAGCKKESGDAVVLAKEHIDAAQPITETPGSNHPARPPETVTAEETPRPMRDDEIAVDSYVMTPEVRGTSRDPRALKDEQWIVKVRMMYDGRTFNVQTDQAHFGKLKEGDRVRVTYRIGKYTNTVWSAEIKEQ